VAGERSVPSLDDARKLVLDDDLSAYPSGQTVVIGCGNLLRGDDAVGPTLVRHLWEQGIPDEVTLVDGGTAGMDVAFKMRGAREVVLIDAAATGADPGTIYKVPGEEVEQLPPLEGLHSHQFRWDHALAFAHWLLGDQYPDDITVYLIEAESTEPGAELTPAVEAAMHQVGAMVQSHWQNDAGSAR
jgi:hydrogenase maturation protease